MNNTTYIITKSYYVGRKFARKMLDKDEPFKILYKPEQLKHLALIHSNCIYLATADKDMNMALVEALCGARVFGHLEWAEKHD